MPRALAIETADEDSLVGSGLAARTAELSAAGLRNVEERGLITSVRTVDGRRLYRWGDVLRLRARRDAATHAKQPVKA